MRQWLSIGLALVLGCSSSGEVSGSPDGGALPDASEVDVDVFEDAPDAPDEPPPAVLTQHFDNLRTGANTHEHLLNTSTVKPGSFGLLFSRTVQGQIYAQPLFVPKLEIPGRGVHDVVFVATEHNDVYAFDADDPAANDPLWHVWLGPPMPSSDMDEENGAPYRDIHPEVGITATPVIDLETKTLYLDAKTKEDGAWFYRVHAMELATGKEKPGSPVELDLRCAGNARDAVGGEVHQDHKHTLMRPGLALDHGTLWVVGGGHGDVGAFHGWVNAYDPATLKKRGTICTTPNGWAGGIWQSGQGPAIDEEGTVYVMTGNGDYDTTLSPPTLSESFLRVQLKDTNLSLVDWFTPFNQHELDAADLDLGSSGVVILPKSKLIFGGGKEGKLYLVDRRRMGHQHTGDDSQIVQSFQATAGTPTLHIHGAPIFWEGPGGPRIYLWGEGDVVRAYRFHRDGELGTFETEAFTQGPFALPAGMPGGILSLSSSGNVPGTGIVWGNHQTEENSNGGFIVEGALTAFDAEDLSRVLWTSTADPRDRVGKFGKFAPPTVVAGKVFFPTFSDRLQVYGLRH